ncbi:MAG TPA: hypothetical protein VFU72_08600 [Nitrolancea sp.]|nr:hypothetical protein [Nitrolancea sp.]
MKERPRTRFWVEAGFATLSLIFAVLTLIWKDWIEIVFRIDPDNHSGSLEWLIAFAALAIAIIIAGVARAEWRHTASATA